MPVITAPLFFFEKFLYGKEERQHHSSSSRLLSSPPPLLSSLPFFSALLTAVTPSSEVERRAPHVSRLISHFIHPYQTERQERSPHPKTKKKGKVGGIKERNERREEKYKKHVWAERLGFIVENTSNPLHSPTLLVPPTLSEPVTWLVWTRCLTC